MDKLNRWFWFYGALGVSAPRLRRIDIKGAEHQVAVPARK